MTTGRKVEGKRILRALALAAAAMIPSLLAAPSLAATIDAVRALRERVRAARAGFEGLPRLPVDPGAVPEPVAHEPLGT